MIKILHTLPDLHIGGVAKLLLKLLNSFDNKDFEHHLCYFGNNESLLSSFREINVHIHKISYDGFWDFPVCCLKLHQLLKEKEIDIIHNNLFVDRALVGVVSFFNKIPVVTSIHTTNSLKDHKSVKKRLLILFEDVLACLSTTRFIAVSNTVKEVAIKYRFVKEEKVQTIYSGVKIPPKITRGIRNKSKITILSVGRLIDTKGFDDLLAIFKIVNQRVSNSELLIIGDGPERKKLEELSGQMKLSSQVKFVGFVKDVPNYLRSADIYVSCSTEEGFGISVVEAMSFSLPVITYEIPIFEEISNNGKFFKLIPERDFKGFARKILEVSNSEFDYKLYCDHSYYGSKINFDIKKCSQKYLGVYSKILT